MSADQPVVYLRENEDGSLTVWLGTYEAGPGDPADTPSNLTSGRDRCLAYAAELAQKSECGCLWVN